jgi:hypothetical protein
MLDPAALPTVRIESVNAQEAQLRLDLAPDEDSRCPYPLTLQDR